MFPEYRGARLQGLASFPYSLTPIAIDIDTEAQWRLAEWPVRRDGCSSVDPISQPAPRHFRVAVCEFGGVFSGNPVVDAEGGAPVAGIATDRHAL